MKLTLDGRTVTALPKYDSNDGYCLEIPNISLGRHTVSAIDNDNYILSWSNNVIDCFFSIDTLYVKPRQPGIAQVVSDVSNSSSNILAHFLKGVDRAAATFTVLGNWNKQIAGYYEVGAGSSTNSIRTLLTTQSNQFSIKPQEVLKAGEHMYCRMVSANGEKSSWLDAKIQAADLPDLGSQCNVSYRDGKYRFSTSLLLNAMTGGKGTSLEDIPLIKNSSFGLGGGIYAMTGTMEDDVIGSLIKMNFEDSSSSSVIKAVKKTKTKTVSTGFDYYTEIEADAIWRYYDKWNLWSKHENSYNFNGGGSISKSVSMSVPKLNWPDIIKGTVKAGAGVSGAMSFEDSNTYNGTLGFAPFVEGDISFGMPLANITGSVWGTIAAQMGFDNKRVNWVTIEPSIKAKIVADYLFHSSTLYKKTFFDETYRWPSANSLLKSISLKALASSPLLETKNFQPVSRSYLNRQSVWNGSGGTKLLKAAAFSTGSAGLSSSAGSVETLKTNVNPVSDIAQIQSGSIPWMIWTDDNGSVATNNCSQLEYSLKKGSAWQRPTEFDKDGTSDFAPAAASTGRGVLLAWQNINQSLTDGADIETIGKNAEITVTRETLTGDNDGAPVTLTHDGLADYNPRLAADGNSALLVWQKTSNSDPQQKSGDDAELYYSKWDENEKSWSDPAKIDTSGHPVVDTSLAMQDGKGLLLYTLDTDGDLSTTDDRELFARVFKDGIWDDAEQLTHNKIEDSTPQAVSLNGNWFLMWNEDGSVVYQTGLDGKMKKADELSGGGSNYKTAVTDGKLALVYTIAGENATRTLSASFYDGKSGTWSGEVPLTEGNDGYVGSFSPAYTSGGKLTVAYTRADLVTEVVNGEEYPGPSNKVDLKLLTYSQLHDLALDSKAGLQFSSDNPLPHTTDTVTVTVENEGDYAENATVSLYNGNPESGGVKVGEGTAEEPISARSSAQVNIDWNVGSDLSDSYDFYAVVSPSDGVTDSKPANNIIHRTMSSADFAFSDVTCVNLSRNSYLLSAAVANNGSKTLSGVVVQLADDKSGKVLASKMLTEMAPGLDGSVNILFSSDGLTKGDDGAVGVTVTAVLPNGLTDNNPDDNTSQFDLKPSPITVETVNPGPGEAQVTPQTPVAMTFNMDVDKGSGFENIKLLDSSLNSVAITKTISDNTLKITPTDTMNKGTQYTLTIPQDALGDSYGHTMEAPYTLSVTTTTSNPEVVFSNPGTNMQEVALDSFIKLKYNQSIVKGSSFDSITVTEPNAKTVSASAALSGEWITLKPAEALEKGSEYSVTVPMGAVKNVDGEVQQETYTLNFQTISNLSELQSLYDSCITITQGSYTDASWTAFTAALAQADTILNEENPSQDKILAAIEALTAAKNGLTKNSDHHSSNSNEENADTNQAETVQPAQNPNFQSDTTETYHFGSNTAYYYKITTTDTITPTAVSSNPLVAAVEFAQKLSDGYLFRVTQVGAGEAVITTTAGDGTKTSFPVQVPADPQGISSDTPYYHEVKKGNTYQFRFTMLSGNGEPVFTVGGGNIKPITLRKIGNAYYYKILMTGSGSAGVYVSLPGKPPVRRCVLTVP